VVGGNPGGGGVDLEQRLLHPLERVAFAGVVEVHDDAVDAGKALGVLLLDRRHHQRRVPAAEDERDRPLGRDVVEAGQVGDPRRVEDDQRVKVRGLHPGPDRRPAAGELLRRDLRRFQ